MPTSRRRPPLPRRTSSAPRRRKQKRSSAASLTVRLAWAQEPRRMRRRDDGTLDGARAHVMVEPPVAFDLEAWSDYGLAVVGAAAALTGLLFVAVSVNSAWFSSSSTACLPAVLSPRR
jgi:hypothetical protein